MVSTEEMLALIFKETYFHLVTVPVSKTDWQTVTCCLSLYGPWAKNGLYIFNG